MSGSSPARPGGRVGEIPGAYVAAGLPCRVAGPLKLSVPDTGDRHHVLQFIDAWTNNFAYAGTRASGSSARQYLVTPPSWAGQVPDGLIQIPTPTHVASILGRWACSTGPRQWKKSDRATAYPERALSARVGGGNDIAGSQVGSRQRQPAGHVRLPPAASAAAEPRQASQEPSGDGRAPRR
jgi:Protein of unknown function (DUF1254)